MKSSQIIAVLIAIAAAVWIGSGFLMAAPKPKEEQASSAMLDAQAQELQIQKVRVRESVAQDFVSDVVVTGRTQASRSVVLRAETEGQVAEIAHEKGDVVAQGDVLAKLDARDRYARMRETQERVKQREIEFNAAQKLQDKGFNSRVRLAQAKADLESARAELRTAQVDVSNIKIAAPFDGVIYEQSVELGDFLSVGDELFGIVDLSPLEIVGFLSERQINDIALGSEARAEMLSGQNITGTVSFIAPAADPDTRTFRVEITVPNENYEIKEGLTAQLHIPTPPRQAHKISPSILALNDAGKIGVKIVGEDNRVKFLPVTILSDKPDHMWIDGLPGRARLITVGQDFVAPGQLVEAATAQGDGLL